MLIWKESSLRTLREVKDRTVCSALCALHCVCCTALYSTVCTVMCVQYCMSCTALQCCTETRENCTVFSHISQYVTLCNISNIM
jgi:hypothetical protein